MQNKEINRPIDFNKNFLIPLACYIDDSLFPFEKRLLYYFLKELGLKSVMQLTVSLLFDRHNIQHYETGMNILEKKSYNPFFFDLLSNYYSKKKQEVVEQKDTEPEEIKFELFLNRILHLVSNFALKKLKNINEISQARFLLKEHKHVCVSPYLKYLPESEVKIIDSFYIDIDALIAEYEKNIISNATKKDLKDLLLEIIIDASLQLQQNIQILNKDKNAPIENNRTAILMLIINNQGLLRAEPRKIGNTSTKKSIGNTDFVLLNKNKILSICEAINIPQNSFPKGKIKKHIDRIFLYDNNGLPFNFFILYIERKEPINSIWLTYSKAINNMAFRHKLNAEIKDVSLELPTVKYMLEGKIKKISFELPILNENLLIVGLTSHDRNGINLDIYHILIFLE